MKSPSNEDPLQYDPSRIYIELIATGEHWSNADAAAWLLEETRKPVLAEIKLRSDEKSDAARETVALASTEYREHVAAMVEARRVANLARVRYDAVRMLAEMRRTEQATRRAEMQLV